MRRWTGWQNFWVAKSGWWSPRSAKSLGSSMPGRWGNRRRRWNAEDAGIERWRAWHLRDPSPCGCSHHHRPCSICWYPRPGWTIRTVRKPPQRFKTLYLDTWIEHNSGRTT